MTIFESGVTSEQLVTQETDTEAILRLEPLLKEWRRCHMIRYISRQTDDFRGEYRVNYPHKPEELLASQALFSELGPIVQDKRFDPATSMDLTGDEFLVIKGEIDQRTQQLEIPE